MGAGSFLTLGDGSGVLTLGDGSGSLLLGDQTATVPVVILFDEDDLIPAPVKEKVTGRFKAKLINEDGDQVEAGTIQAITLVVMDQSSNTVLRHDDALDLNDVTLDEQELDTFLTWLFDTQDSRLLDRSNRSEQHIATFQFGWGAASTGSGTDLLSTTISTQLATITITGHGVSVTDTEDKHRLFLQTTAAVGGVTFAGRYVVKRAIDTNTLEIRLNCDATATESNGGGTVEWWLDGSISTGEVIIPVERNDPYCD